MVKAYMQPIMVGVLFLLISQLVVASSQATLDEIVDEARAELSDISGLSIKIIENNAVFDGKILLPKDFNRIHNFIGRYPKQIISAVQIKPFAAKKIAEIIQRDIAVNVSDKIQVEYSNYQFILTGQVEKEADLHQAELITRTYAPPESFDVINRAVVKSPQ